MIKESDYIWSRYWDLVILSFVRKEKRQRIVLCSCNCWNEKEMILANVRKNKWSCWCKKWRITHWYSKRWNKYRWLYFLYIWMLDRCYNKNNIRYSSYWLRWIWVCDERREDISCFINDMYDSYIKHLNTYWKNNTTLDRIDNNIWYSKDNCRWLTRQQQNNNTSRNIYFTIWEEIYNQKEFCKIVWVCEDTVRRRLREWLTKNEIINEFIKN